MGFWTTYFALLAAMVTMEAAHMGFSYYMTRRQMAKDEAQQKEAQAKLADLMGISMGEMEEKVEKINSAREEKETEMAAKLFSTLPTEALAAEVPTVSGEAEEKKDEHDGQGQYL